MHRGYRRLKEKPRENPKVSEEHFFLRGLKGSNSIYLGIFHGHRGPTSQDFQGEELFAKISMNLVGTSQNPSCKFSNVGKTFGKKLQINLQYIRRHRLGAAKFIPK